MPDTDRQGAEPSTGKRRTFVSIPSHRGTSKQQLSSMLRSFPCLKRHLLCILCFMKTFAPRSSTVQRENFKKNTFMMPVYCSCQSKIFTLKCYALNTRFPYFLGSLLSKSSYILALNSRFESRCFQKGGRDAPLPHLSSETALPLILQNIRNDNFLR